MVKAEDIIKDQKNREDIRKKTYKKILERIFNKIKLTSSTNLKGCWYQVPEFLLGLPIYKLDECKKYLIRKLKKNGFKITELENNIIYISWDI